MSLKNPPITEMSLATQFSQRLDIQPEQMLGLWERFKSELPKLEFKPPIGPLGGQSAPIFEMGEDIRLRYWFGSTDDIDLLQYQDDLVALNWRRRPVIGAAARPYPGFEEMRNRYDTYLSAYSALVGAESVPVSTCNLYYDNVWALKEGQGFGEAFTFWKKLGITMRGPQVGFSIALDHELLGSGARIDITAMVIGTVHDDGVRASARLVIAAYAHPGTLSRVVPAINQLHVHVTDYLPKLVSEEARSDW